MTFNRYTASTTPAGSPQTSFSSRWHERFKTLEKYPIFYPNSLMSTKNHWFSSKNRSFCAENGGVLHFKWLLFADPGRLRRRWYHHWAVWSILTNIYRYGRSEIEHISSAVRGGRACDSGERIDRAKRGANPAGQIDFHAKNDGLCAENAELCAENAEFRRQYMRSCTTVCRRRLQRSDRWAFSTVFRPFFDCFSTVCECFSTLFRQIWVVFCRAEHLCEAPVTAPGGTAGANADAERCAKNALFTLFLCCFHAVFILFLRCFYAVFMLFSCCFYTVFTLFLRCFYAVFMLFLYCFYAVFLLFLRCVCWVLKMINLIRRRWQRASTWTETDTWRCVGWENIPC